MVQLRFYLSDLSFLSGAVFTKNSDLGHRYQAIEQLTKTYYHILFYYIIFIIITYITSFFFAFCMT